jgi:putative redox protein
MTATISYEGNLRCSAKHLQSGTAIETDAPTDNRGKGERFSPTDLVCTALATCMITTMAMKATDMGIELKGTEIDVQKHMASDPRRIAKIDITLTFPAGFTLTEKDSIILKRISESCPVIRSLHPDVIVNIEYKNAAA